jgi:hypothetical protein
LFCIFTLILTDLEGENFVEKCFEDENISDVPIPTCEEEYGSHERKSIDTHLHIEKRRKNRNCLYFDGDPIYDTNSETVRALGLNFQIWSLLDSQACLEVFARIFMSDKQPCVYAHFVTIVVYAHGHMQRSHAQTTTVRLLCMMPTGLHSRPGPFLIYKQ